MNPRKEKTGMALYKSTHVGILARALIGAAMGERIASEDQLAAQEGGGSKRPRYEANDGARKSVAIVDDERQ